MNIKFGIFPWLMLAAIILLSTLEAATVEPYGLRRIYNMIRDFFYNRMERTGKAPGIINAGNKNRIQPIFENDFPFPCNVTNTRSPVPPVSVHQLRPGDIDVIGAIGDSLTAANGAAADNIIHLYTENRGLSAFIGGQGTWRQFLTLPNILKEFNPKLIGYSLGDSLGHHKMSQFNVAEPLSMSEDTIYQARELVRRIKNDPRVDFDKHWKLVTVFIGANDFCSNFCYLSPKGFKNAAETHRRQLMSTLDYLRDNLPRTFVNLVLTPNLGSLHDLKGLPARCDTLHLITCPCLFGKHREATYKANINKQTEWQNVQKEVANDERYQFRPDFAVVLQTFTANIDIPKVYYGVTDKSYLSEDCFHLSQKSYAAVANAIWNNMLEPVGNKSLNWTPLFAKFLCPTEEHPFIYTQANSKKR